MSKVLINLTRPLISLFTHINYRIFARKLYPRLIKLRNHSFYSTTDTGVFYCHTSLSTLLADAACGLSAAIDSASSKERTTRARVYVAHCNWITTTRDVTTDKRLTVAFDSVRASRLPLRRYKYETNTHRWNFSLRSINCRRVAPEEKAKPLTSVASRFNPERAASSNLLRDPRVEQIGKKCFRHPSLLDEYFCENARGDNDVSAFYIGREICEKWEICSVDINSMFTHTNIKHFFYNQKISARVHMSTLIFYVLFIYIYIYAHFLLTWVSRESDCLFLQIVCFYLNKRI